MTFASQAKRTSSLLAAIGFAFATILSVVILAQNQASAYGLPTQRYVQMSSSANAGGAGISSGVSYEVGFKIATAGPVEGIVVDFCSDTPLIGTSCTAPTGFTVGTPTVATNTGASDLGTGWTSGNANSGRTLTLTHSTGPTLSVNDDAVLTISTVTNPSTDPEATFYARIFTFAVDTQVATWVATANGSATANVIDAGGVALATAQRLTVTAKVQETLTFCVYETSCGTGSAVTLGDGNGVLASNVIDYNDTASYDLGSNAANGVTVRIKGPTLTSGGNTITAFGNACAADSTTATVEQFGLRLSTVGAGQTAVVPYNCSADLHGFDDNGTDGTTSTYGDILATTSAGTASSTSVLEFAAKSATTTEAGVYTTDLAFIATGKY